MRPRRCGGSSPRRSKRSRALRARPRSTTTNARWAGGNQSTTRPRSPASITRRCCSTRPTPRAWPVTSDAADLARAGLDEAYALDASRGVEVVGRSYSSVWQADGADFGTTTLLPVLDRVDPVARARFLVSRVEHLVAYGTPAEVREPAAQMMAALRGVSDPVLEARAYLVSAWCYEAYGDFERVEAEYERAAEIARNANAPSMLALVLYNHAAGSSGPVPRVLSRAPACSGTAHRRGRDRGTSSRARTRSGRYG